MIPLAATGKQNSLGRKRRNNFKSGITLLTSEIDEDKTKKNSLKSKRMTKIEKKESEKGKAIIEKTVSIKKDKR